jgi:NHL repeat
MLGFGVKSQRRAADANGVARIWLAFAVLIALLWSSAAAPASVTSFGGPGSGGGQFSALNAIALDAAGNVYAVDGGSASRVQKFSNTGEFLRKWGSNGTGDGQLMGSYAIGVGPSGHVYVGDYGNNRIEVFTADGTYLRSMGHHEFSDGNRRRCKRACVGLGRRPSHGVHVGRDGAPAVGVHADANNEFWNMGDLALGPSGDLYEIERNEVRVQRFTAAGTPLPACGQPSGGYGDQAGAADGMFDQGVGGLGLRTWPQTAKGSSSSPTDPRSIGLTLRCQRSSRSTTSRG